MKVCVEPAGLEPAPS